MKTGVSGSRFGVGILVEAELYFDVAAPDKDNALVPALCPVQVVIDAVDRTHILIEEHVAEFEQLFRSDCKLR